MAPALYTTPSKAMAEKEGSGLYVETRDGHLKQVALPSDSLLFMLGEGIHMWLDEVSLSPPFPPLSYNFRSLLYYGLHRTTF